jgi:hypothetical protein
MAQPVAYNREYNFTNYQSNHPNNPLPAAHVDAEYNRVKRTLDQIRAKLALIQRDDGALANHIVTFDALSEELQNLIGGGYSPSFITETDDFTVTAAMSGGWVLVDSATPVTVTLPGTLPVSTNVVLVQVGAGSFTLAAGSGASLKNKYDWYASEGQDASITAIVRANDDDVSAVWQINGDVSP